MNIDSPFEQWRLKYMKGTAASREIMELLALAFEGGRVAEREACAKLCDNEVIPVYTAPPKREWVGLTSEDWENTPDTGKQGCERDAELFDWIEQTLKEKNT